MKDHLVPICLIVGFLGSGKTTLLKRLARTCAHQRLAFIVNEFSALDVDGEVMRREHDKVLCLAGGSVFCKCLSGQFIQALKDLPKALHIPHCDGVVVEASGIADPGVAGKMLFETGLDALYRLSRVIAVVDPGNIGELLSKLPNTRAQLLAADIIILNKQDVYSPEEMEAARRVVVEVNDGAQVVQCAHCEVDIDIADGESAARASGNYAPCADPNFANAVAHVADPVDVDRLLRAMNASKGELYRAKGFLMGADGPLYLDWTPSTVSRFELPEYEGPFAFTFIGDGAKASAVAAMAARLESGVFTRLGG